MEWILANKEWLFSGCGVTLLAYLVSRFLKSKDSATADRGGNHVLTITNTVNPSPGVQQIATQSSPTTMLGAAMKKSLADYKEETRILFIDDDVRFKVAKILIRSGWKYTKLIKDADNLDIAEIIEADILFIDVQGVGGSLGFNDEGLGLALAIKEKYPQKKVVIYSAETQGDRFHAALRKADSFLHKNADPYEFQKIVEEFTVGIVGK